MKFTHILIFMAVAFSTVLNAQDGSAKLDTTINTFTRNEKGEMFKVNQEIYSNGKIVTTTVPVQDTTTAMEGLRTEYKQKIGYTFNNYVEVMKDKARRDEVINEATELEQTYKTNLLDTTGISFLTNGEHRFIIKGKEADELNFKVKAKGKVIFVRKSDGAQGRVVYIAPGYIRLYGYSCDKYNEFLLVTTDKGKMLFLSNDNDDRIIVDNTIGERK